LPCGLADLASAKAVRILNFNTTADAAYEVHRNATAVATVAASPTGSLAVDLSAAAGDRIVFAPNSDLQPPPPPLFTAVASVSPGCVRATWLPSGDPTVVGYVVSYGNASVAAGEATGYDQSINAGAVTAQDVCMLASGRYYFAVRTRNYAGMLSAFSPERMVDIATVAVLISWFDARLESGDVRLSWRVDADEVVRGYRVYRSDADSPEALLFPDLLASGASTFVDGDVHAAATYTYVLGAVKENGDEVRSVPVTVTTPGLTTTLEQNAPNPFNPTTTIPFTLAAAAHVALVIYDVRGSRVATLFAGNLSEGRHEVEWSGRDDSGQPVSSGSYFYALTVGKRTLSARMVLLK
jgi:hypothetical protein